MHTPELLSPAGTLKNLHYALAYGADAVYAGQPRYSLRVRNNDFNTLDNLATGIATTHQQGKAFYVASNIAAHNTKVKTFLRDIEPIIDLQPDGLIMSDPGLIMLVREHFPDMPIHLSVQANAVNYATVQFWQQQGLTRVILSRELSLEEVAEIRDTCPKMELEVFVHGALCIAYSGRCLLSGYMNHRDPNQGTCTNACRWQYDLHSTQDDGSGDVQLAKPLPAPTLGTGDTQTQVFLLEERNRPGEYMPVEEDEHGTYIMNSKDLRAVQHVAQLTQIGVESLKIEGRTKSHYYVARTTQIYRQAIDDAVAGKNFNMHLMDELENLANRGYTEGFYRRHVHDEYQNYLDGNSRSEQQQFVGEIQDVSDDKIEIAVKNRFVQGDEVELLLPQGNVRFHVEAMENDKGKAVDVAPGSSYVVRLPRPKAAVGDLSMGLLVRCCA